MRDGVKAPLPVWAAAVLPAALVGHGLAYAAAGRPLIDAHHAWLAPAFELSAAFLIALCLALAGGTLIRIKVLAHSSIERSMLALWPRMALAQIAAFVLMERAEGSHAALFGCLIQIAVALGAASLLSLFARLLVRCVRLASQACAYIERLRTVGRVFVLGEPRTCAFALAVVAGSHRFQRPPPRP
jgi:hypothetical protein